MNQVTNYTWDVNSWDVNSPLPQVIQDTNNAYVYGLDLISSTNGSGMTTFYTGDGLGSTTDLTNSAGAVTDTYKYDVFGTATHTSGTSANYWQFTGEQSDKILNPNDSLYSLRARYYDTATGRFMSQDPMRGQQPQPQSLNPYAYALNNPANRVDPTGLNSELVGIPTTCVEFLAGSVFAAIAPGLFFAPAAPLLLPLQIMYVFTVTLSVTYQVLDAYQQSDITGTAVTSEDLLGIFAQALVKDPTAATYAAGFLTSVPSIVADFLDCKRSVT